MNSFIILTATAIVIIFWKFLIWLYKFIKFCFVINKIPGPSPYPFPTLIFQVMNLKLEDRLQWVTDLRRKYDNHGMIKVSIANEAAVILWKPRHLEVLFPSTENIQKSFMYDKLAPWLGEALLTSSGKKWFHQRKMITPAFHFGVVDLFTQTMSEKAEVLNQIIEGKIKENPDKPVDFFELAIRCALDIICETAMGVDMNVQINYSTEYITALQKAAETFFHRIKYPWLKWDWIFWKSKSGKEFKSAVDTMSNFTMEIIKNKQRSRKLSLENSKAEDGDVTEKRIKKAFLDLLLDVNEEQAIPMTETELREQVDTFMFAGHDTTGAAINWTIFNLGNNPEIQRKVHEELDQIFGDSTEPATMKQISELKYLDRVIKENLRLYPSVPEFGRRLSQDIKLDGYLIPKGCNVSMAVFTLHRDPELWPDPLTFDPDRFLPENCKGRHPYAYVPFSAGPRNCIGQKFAMVELKIVLSAILRKWRVQSAKTQAEMKLVPTLILRPYDGNLMYFIPRK